MSEHAATVHAARLDSLRAALAAQGLDGFILHRTDHHGSEYLPDCEQRLAWLTGFTGSAGQAALAGAHAAVFVDGRYTAQMAQEVDPALFQHCHVAETGPVDWLREHVEEGMRIGYDPMHVRKGERRQLAAMLEAKGASLVAVAANPVDALWTDRPEPPLAPAMLLDLRHAGESSADKRARMGRAVADAGAEWLLVTATDSIAWLLNVRGADIPFNPLVLSYLLLRADGSCRWFVDARKIGADVVLDEDVAIEPYESILPALDGLGAAGMRILVDPAQTHVGFADRLEQAGARIVEAADPIVLAKARKNATEIEGAIAAQKRDGAAICRFLCWLDGIPRDGSLTELDAARQLEAERAKDPLFRGASFETISAHGPNAALPHYRVEADSARPLTDNAIYLVDSGGQYLDGTTDITRTVALGEVTDEMRERFTLVLKGHIALATARFPAGTSGAQLDTLARQFLWQAGLDFDHGTGHGIGAYLCVHEGPQRIARTGTQQLLPGMILSNEPGYYRPGHYGIRIENLLLVTDVPSPPGGERRLLGFRNLTLAPIDRRLIAADLLTAGERQWVDDYHAGVREALEGELDAATASWLKTVTAPLG